MQGIRSKAWRGAATSVRAGIPFVAVLLAGCAGMDNPLAGLGGSGGAGSGTGGGAATQGTPAPALAILATDVPAAPTAVVESSYSIDGAIMPVMRGQMRTATRADMRRNDSQVAFDNWLMRRVGGDGRNTDITRIDRKLVWDLEPAKRLYSECPITGCGRPAQQPGRQDDKGESKQPAEPSCPVTVKVNELKVSPTGERRTINGFATEFYGVTWTIALEDGQGRRSTSKVAMDLWTTPETGAIREAQQIDDAYQRRYMAAISTSENPVGRYVPRNVVSAMSAFVKGMDAKDAHTLQAMAAEMRKIRGYPIRTTMSWTMEGAVCSDSAMPAGGMPSLGGMLGAITGNKPAASQSGPAPMIVFESEVKTLAVKPVSDSAFVPPPDYQRK